MTAVEHYLIMHYLYKYVWVLTGAPLAPAGPAGPEGPPGP